MVEVTEAFLQQFVEGLKEAAAAQKESAGALQTVAVELRSLADESRQGRISAVEEVKNHVTVQMKLSNRWPTILMGILTALAMVAVGILGIIAAHAR